MKRISLRVLVILSVVVYHVVLVVFLIVPLVQHMHELQEEELRVTGDETLALLGAFLGDRTEIDRDAASRLDKMLATSEIFENLRVTDSVGRDLYSSKRIDEESGHDGKEGFGILDFMHSGGHEFERTLVTDYGESPLTLSLILNTQPFNSIMAHHTYSALRLFFIIISAFFAIVFFADRTLKRATAHLIAITRRMREGELDLKIALHTGDEMEQLAESFNEMADSLKQRTSELTRLKNFHEGIVQSINQGLVLVNKYGLITYCNKSFSVLVGRNLSTLLGTPLTAHLPYLNSAELADTVGRLLEGNEVQNPARTFTLRVGGERVVDEFWTTQKGKGVEVEGFILLITDVSERSRLRAELEKYTENLEMLVEERTSKLRDSQEQLIHAEKMSALGVFAAGVAHEISNPLSGILNAVELLRRQLAESSSQICDEIIQNILRVQEIINDLVDYARPRYNISGEVDLNEVIERVVSFFQRQPKFKSQKISYTPIPNLNPISIDANKLEHVLHNLLLNALQATGEGGEVVFSVSEDYRLNKLSIEVADNGPGIPEEIRKDIFTPFFSTKPAGQGTGLGLSLSQRLMTEMGGALFLDEETRDGARFIVELPSNPATDSLTELEYN